MREQTHGLDNRVRIALTVLERKGVIAPPHRTLDVRHFLGRKKVVLREGTSAVRDLLAERGEAR